MFGPILEQKPKEAFKVFSLYYEIITKKKLNISYSEIIKYSKQQQNLQDRWYDSIKKKKVDYGVYNENDYLAELWACWVHCSRKYLLKIISDKSMSNGGIMANIGNVKRVVDLGCGIGYSTIALKQIFSDSEVIGTNLENTIQMNFLKKLAIKNNFIIISDLKEINKPIDVVFASEYFEHFFEPIEHLKEILNILQPRIIFTANAFGPKAIGHFDYYSAYDNQDKWLKLFNPKKTSILFNNELRKQGYIKMKTNLWNNRPVFWKK